MSYTAWDGLAADRIIRKLVEANVFDHWDAAGVWVGGVALDLDPEDVTYLERRHLERRQPQRSEPSTFVATTFSWSITDQQGTWTDENPGPYTVTRGANGEALIARTQPS